MSNARWLIIALLLVGCAGSSQQKFESPEAAAEALVSALSQTDTATVNAILGPEADQLRHSGDSVQDEAARARFIELYRKNHSLTGEGDERTLVIGEQDWPLPIPIVKDGSRWRFDGERGVQELLYRRIGANELGAIAVCRGFVEAQKDYAASGHDGDPSGIYAMKLVSDPGFENGLYWPTAEGAPPSPAGPFIAAASAEGYRAGGGTPYHGYRYRMLYRQGANANGGARDYFVDGVLTGGFALVAWPSEYGTSGVKTFVVNQDGIVYEKDLGEDTDTEVQKIDIFDPDSSWTVVQDTPA